MIPAIATATSMRKILGDPDAAFAVTDYLKRCPTFPTVEELSKISGIGTRKAEILTGVFELQQQYFLGTELKSILRPEDIFHQELAWMKYAPQENFVCITLDSANHVIKTHEISRGLINQTPVHCREAFRNAIMDNACSVMFAHNHPSGSSEPSREDIAITRTLCACGKIIQIPVIDHIIISKVSFTSLCRENPEIFENTINQERT